MQAARPALGPFTRPLLPCLAMYLLGLWLAREFWLSAPFSVMSVSAVGLLVAGAWSFRRRELTPMVLLLCAGFGFLRMLPINAERERASEIAEALDDGRLRPFEGTIRSARGAAASGNEQFTLTGVLITSGTDVIRMPGRVALTLQRAGSASMAELVPGDHIRGAAMIGPPRGFRNFTLSNQSEVLALGGIYATMRIPAADLVERADEAGSANALRSLSAAFVSARRFALGALARHIPAHEARMTASMVFNEYRFLTEADQRIFRDSGTMHLFAVSGMHVAVFSLVLLAVLRSVRFGRRGAWSVLVAVIGLYVTMLDFVTPAVRAFLLVVAYWMGSWMRREVDSLSALTFAAALVVLFDPLAMWQASFILSVMGALSLAVFMPLFAQWLHVGPEHGGWRYMLLRWLSDSAQVLLAVTIVLLPLQFFYFQQFNLLSPIANLAAAALSAPLLSAAAATIFLAPLSDSLASLMGASAGALMRTLYWSAEETSAQAWAILHAARPPAWTVFGYYLVLFSGYYIVRRDTPEFRPKSAARLAIHTSAAMALLALALSWRAVPPRPLRIWFLDVGQGDSAVVELPGGQSIVIDAGSASPDAGQLVVAPQLRALGIPQPGNLIITHPDSDHAGGAPSLLRNCPVRGLARGGAGAWSDTPLARLVMDTATSCGIPCAAILAGPPIRLDPGVEIEVLNPAAELDGSPASDNERSVVLSIRYGKFRALFMGDADAAVEERLVRSGIGTADVLKVSHHGSATATTAAFLGAVRPRFAVVSCGWHNRFGHPSRAVLDRLSQCGARVHRTDDSGAVLVESDGETYRAETAVPDRR